MKKAGEGQPSTTNQAQQNATKKSTIIATAGAGTTATASSADPEKVSIGAQPKKSSAGPSSGSSGAADPKKALASTNLGTTTTTTTTTTHDTNWRETDKQFHQLVQQDKKNFQAGVPTAKRSTASQGNLGLGKAGHLVPVMVELEVVVVIEARSAPNLGAGTIVTHHRPFDPNLLPIEKPVDYSQYIQCPHCGRKFEKLAAARHIPQCEEYDFNKEEKDDYRKSRSKSK